jgi:glycerol-3-phosphate dehydrogenase
VSAGDATNTAALSRDHTIHIDEFGLLSIAGGKWTTYRNMAEDCVDQAAMLASLPEQPSVTKELSIHGYHPNAETFGLLQAYGADAPFVENLIQSDAALGVQLHPDLPIRAAQVVWAVREELARTVEDVLARRTRALFLNARAAVMMAPRVAELMARELQRDRAWEQEQVSKFSQLARGYTVRD